MNIVAENRRLEQTLAQVEVIKIMPEEYQLAALVNLPIESIGQIRATEYGKQKN